MNHRSSAIKITGYRSVGDFLAGYVAYRKTRQKNFSYRLLSKAMKIRSSSQLTMITRGERVPSENLLTLMARYFNFTQREFNYAFAITKLQRAQDDDEKNYFLKLVDLFAEDKTEKILDGKSLSLMTHWSMFAILALAECHDFELEPEYIQRKIGFKITQKQARDAIQLLKELNLIALNESGKYVKAQNHIKTSVDIPSETIKQLHLQILDLAKNSLLQHSVQKRHFSSSMIAISEDKIPLAKKLIADFREKFIAELSDKKCDMVFHLGIQFFGF